MDCIEFSANKDGSVKVERIIAGVVVDRFIVKRHSLAVKRTDSWIIKAKTLLMESSAGIVIQVPPVPPLQPTQLELKDNLICKLLEVSIVASKELANLEDAKLLHSHPMTHKDHTELHLDCAECQPALNAAVNAARIDRS